RVDPEDVAVAVRHADARERPTAIDRSPGAQVQDVNGILVLRVRGDERKVPRADHELLVGVDAVPRLARVVRAEDAARRVRWLDAGPEARGIGRRDGDPDTPEGARRKAVIRCDVGPRAAAVRALPESALAAAGGEAP